MLDRMAQHASILGLIDREIERLHAVRALFPEESSGAQSSGKRPGRPAGKRELSEEARQRIVAGQKKRWAAQKKATAS